MTVRREEILSPTDYEPLRATRRGWIRLVKARRRVHLGDSLTFLFENRYTIRDQIQEMVRIEELTDEADVRHELDTYNALLGGPGELAATLLIELPDKAERDEKLARWTDLPDRLYVRLLDGSRVRARYDAAQANDERVSSVQYLKFDTGGRVPIAVGTDHPELTAEVVLTEDQRNALYEDLESEMPAAEAMASR